MIDANRNCEMTVTYFFAKYSEQSSTEYNISTFQHIMNSQKKMTK